MTEQQYEDYPQEPQNVNMYPPIGSRQDKGDILNAIKPDLIVEVIRHKLMGEELIDGVWKPNPALQSKAITKVGAWDLANLMLGVSSQNVSLSNLTDREVRERTLSIVKTAQDMMLKNWKAYGINGTDQMEFIHEIIMSNTFITLKQPQGEGIRKMITGITTENRQVITNKEERGFSLFSRSRH